jgi:hypothetical protein
LFLAQHFALMATYFFPTAGKSKQKVPLAEFRREAADFPHSLTYRAGRHIRVPTITQEIVHDFLYYSE